MATVTLSPSTDPLALWDCDRDDPPLSVRLSPLATEAVGMLMLPDVRARPGALDALRREIGYEPDDEVRIDVGRTVYHVGAQLRPSTVPLAPADLWSGVRGALFDLDVDAPEVPDDVLDVMREHVEPTLDPEVLLVDQLRQLDTIDARRAGESLRHALRDLPSHLAAEFLAALTED